jgi:hypothetical protein
MKLWEKLIIGIAVAGTVGVITWRSGLLDRILHRGQPMESEEVWDVESDERGIPIRITIHRKWWELNNPELAISKGGKDGEGTF